MRLGYPNRSSRDNLLVRVRDLFLLIYIYIYPYEHGAIALSFVQSIKYNINIIKKKNSKMSADACCQSSTNVHLHLKQNSALCDSNNNETTQVKAISPTDECAHDQYTPENGIQEKSDTEHVAEASNDKEDAQQEQHSSAVDETTILPLNEEQLDEETVMKNSESVDNKEELIHPEQLDDSEKTLSLSTDDNKVNNSNNVTTPEPYKDFSGIDTETFISRTIKNNPKDRSLMFQLEQIFRDFINDTKAKTYQFQPMNSYQRMIVHRVSAFFGLDHNVDKSGASIICQKTQNTRIPSFFFENCIPENEPPTPPPSASSPPDIVDTADLVTPSTNSSSINNTKKILRRRDINDTTNGAPSASSSSSSSTTGAPTYNYSVQSSPSQHQRKPFHERQQYYNEVRRKIFNNPGVQPGEQQQQQQQLQQQQQQQNVKILNNDQRQQHQKLYKNSMNMNDSHQTQSNSYSNIQLQSKQHYKNDLSRANEQQSSSERRVPNSMIRRQQQQNYNNSLNSANRNNKSQHYYQNSTQSTTNVPTNNSNNSSNQYNHQYGAKSANTPDINARPPIYPNQQHQPPQQQQQFYVSAPNSFNNPTQIDNKYLLHSNQAGLRSPLSVPLIYPSQPQTSGEYDYNPNLIPVGIVPAFAHANQPQHQIHPHPAFVQTNTNTTIPQQQQQHPHQNTQGLPIYLLPSQPGQQSQYVYFAQPPPQSTSYPLTTINQDGTLSTGGHYLHLYRSEQDRPTASTTDVTAVSYSTAAQTYQHPQLPQQLTLQQQPPTPQSQQQQQQYRLYPTNSTNSPIAQTFNPPQPNFSQGAIQGSTGTIPYQFSGVSPLSSNTGLKTATIFDNGMPNVLSFGSAKTPGNPNTTALFNPSMLIAAAALNNPSHSSNGSEEYHHSQSVQQNSRSLQHQQSYNPQVRYQHQNKYQNQQASAITPFRKNDLYVGQPLVGASPMVTQQRHQYHSSPKNSYYHHPQAYDHSTRNNQRSSTNNNNNNHNNNTNNNSNNNPSTTSQEKQLSPSPTSTQTKENESISLDNAGSVSDTVNTPTSSNEPNNSLSPSSSSSSAMTCVPLPPRQPKNPQNMDDESKNSNTDIKETNDDLKSETNVTQGTFTHVSES
ncbi:unnamed protein product [Didymodactylos carnosus]|uniref:R3H domain-containing protein n=1 Tax=Didymodactylos carnosus TaxID=1234261 RepID=A0A813QHK1_9BILA|nr:unnamed protein product [Didymodactylos carnosus]CAF3548824.1 unnamed protein product [Didymodactylos carnosus]